MTVNKTRWALWGAGTAVVLSAIAATVHLDMPTGANAAPAEQTAPPAVPVTVTTLKPRSVTTWQEFSGRLEAVDRVLIRPRVAGAIQSVHFREGSLVKTGDRLVTIDPAPYEAAVAQAESQVASARARLDLAEVELQRGKTLSANRTISQSELAQRESEFAQAEATLRAAEAALKIARLDLGYTELRAPISGRIGRLEVTQGNLVSAGSSSPELTTIVSVDPIYASFSADEELVTRLLARLPMNEGTPALEQVPVEITASAGDARPIRGKLQLIDNEVDRSSGTIRVRAVFDNRDGRLIPGQFVRIRVGEPTPEDHLLISERAIGADQDKKFVMVVGDDNVAAYRPVRLGANVDGERIVESGVAAGERVIVNGLQRIRPGMTVAPEDESKVASQ